MSQNPTLAALVERLSEARVLCIGDVMLDRFISGEVERISPEAPIPVLHIQDETSMLGGAGNVVRNITTLGGKVDFISVIGDDEAGCEIGALLKENASIETTLLIEDERETAIKTRFLAGNQQMLRADRETVSDVSKETADAIITTATGSLGNVGAVMLSDYGKGVLSDAALHRLIDLAREAGKAVIIDPKGDDYARYNGASLITPNRKELTEASGMATGSDDDIIAASRSLITAYDLGAVLATRSGDGMTLVSADTHHHLSAQAREVFDVSGAGDTVAAAMAAALSIGASLENAAALANAAAGIVVGKVGTAAVYMSELIATLHHQDISDAEAKVRSTDEMVSRVEVWKRQGLKIGFTNGCFDLLHPGHISLLTQAKGASDRLIVGLNSDQSIKRLKGEDRPVQSEAARATVLASLTSVDAVVIFGEDTPLGLIEKLKPNVLIKGADYTEETVVGAKIVKASGGKIFLAKLEDGFSTTSTIERMNNNGD